jgi:hypothetical protein
MNPEIERIQEEFRVHFQNEGCKTGADYGRVFAILLYQERERCALLLEQIAQLKREQSPAPIGPTIAGIV